MDLWGTLRVVLRRWYVVLPALAITVAVAIVAGSRTETTYEASGSTVLISSNDAKTTNPYENFNPSLQTTAQVIANDISSESVRWDFRRNNLNWTYKLVVPYDATRAVLLPEIDYTVQDPDPKVVMKTLDALGKRVTEQLARRQEASGAPADQWIQSVPGPASASATVNTGNRVRATAILILLGVAISLSLAFAAEGIANSRRRRRERKAGVVPEPANTNEVTSALREAVSAMRLAVDVVEDTAMPASSAGGNGNGGGKGAPVGNGHTDAKRADAIERRGAGSRPGIRRRP